MSRFNKTETFNDLQIVSLLENDYAQREAKFSAWYRADGNMEVFLDGYGIWKKSFRGFYSETYLLRSGYDAGTSVDRTVFDDDLLLAHLQGINSDIITVNTASKSHPGEYSVAREYLQNTTYDYSNHEDILRISGATYHHMNAQWYNAYSESHVKITFVNGFWDHDFSEAPDLVIYIANPWADTTCLVASVEYTSDPSPEYYIYIENINTVPSDTYYTDTFLLTAIIPIKESNVFTKEDLYMKRFLNKLGLGGNQLVESLTYDEDGSPSSIDSAYIIEGLPFDSTNQVVIKTLFKTFEYYQAGHDIRITMDISELSMHYRFNVSIVTIGGDLNIGEDRKGRPLYAESELIYQFEPSPDDPGPEMKIRLQEIPGEYREMHITNYANSFTVAGEMVIAFLDSPSEVSRLIIPLDILNGLSFNDFVPVHERSFGMIAFATETVTIKWYERVIGYVIGFVLAIVFGPAGLTIGQLIIHALIQMVIMTAISFILAAIDNPWITAIVGVIMAVYGVSNGTFDFSKLTVENYLPIASSVIDGASTIYSDQIQEEMEEVAAKAEAQAKEDKEMLDSLPPGIDVAKVIQDAHYSHIDSTSADAIIANMLGENAFNIDQYFDVDKEVGIRKTVVSG